MTVLSDSQIKKYVKEKRLIEPFDESLLGPATYDLRVGRRALKSLRRESIVKLRGRKGLTNWHR